MPSQRALILQSHSNANTAQKGFAGRVVYLLKENRYIQSTRVEPRFNTTTESFNIMFSIQRVKVFDFVSFFTG